jgi:hypothetical protein
MRSLMVTLILLLARPMDSQLIFLNGTESARCLIQYIEDIRDPEIYLALFYSNPKLYVDEDERTINVIYYDWLIEKAKKIENFKIVFTFTRQEEPALSSEHPRIVYRKGRFFVGPIENWKEYS